MKRIFIYFLFIVFFIAISGCGSTSSSNSPNIFSTGSFIDALAELETAAGNTNLENEDEEAYGNLFVEETDIGVLDLMSYLFEFMRDFKENADYNETDERWEIDVDNPLTPDVTDITTYYGENDSENNFWIHESTVTDETYGLHVYNDELSFSYYYPGTSDYSSDPGIKIEIYHHGDYYYGFFLYQYYKYNTLMVKIKFNIDNSLSELSGKYGEYTNTPPEPLVLINKNFIDDPDDIESYPLIRINYSSNPDNWFTTNVDINTYLVFGYDGSIFGYSLP